MLALHDAVQDAMSQIQVIGDTMGIRSDSWKHSSIQVDSLSASSPEEVRPMANSMMEYKAMSSPLTSAPPVLPSLQSLSASVTVNVCK
jgi:uncharacterized protein YggE